MENPLTSTASEATSPTVSDNVGDGNSSNVELEPDDGWFYPEQRICRDGDLSLFMNSPEDIFIEIAAYMTPKALLNMARSTKFLRTKLMSKTSKLIWRSSERLVGLPPCPLNMSNPRYASLIFDTFCMRCHEECSKPADIWMGLRFCEYCEVYNKVAKPSPLPDGLTLRDLVALLPGKISFRTIKSEGWFKAPILPLNQFYYKPHLNEALKRYRAVEGDKQAYVEQCSKLLYQRKMHTAEVYAWFSKEKQRRVKVEQEREETICRLLLKQGYTFEDLREVPDEPDWTWLDILRVPCPLTRNEWSTIRPQLEETILKRREHRRKADRERLKQDRINMLIKWFTKIFNHPTTYCHVSLSEVVKLPSASAAINSEEPYIDAVDDYLVQIEEEMFELMEHKQRMITEVLGKKMAIAMWKSKVVPDVHSRTDKWCLTRPYAFFTTREAVLCTFDDVLDALSRKFLETFRYPPTSECDDLNALLFPYFADHQTIWLAKTLFNRLQVPEYTDMQHMNVYEEIFECKICGPLLCKPMDWHGLVDHFEWERMTIVLAARSSHWESMEKAFYKDHMPKFWFEAPFKLLVEDEEDEWEPYDSDSDFSDDESYEEPAPIEAKCRLCKRLGVPTVFTSEPMLNEHMKMKHGKDTWQEANRWMIFDC